MQTARMIVDHDYTIDRIRRTGILDGFPSRRSLRNIHETKDPASSCKIPKAGSGLSVILSFGHSPSH